MFIFVSTEISGHNIECVKENKNGRVTNMLLLFYCINVYRITVFYANAKLQIQKGSEAKPKRLRRISDEEERKI